MSEAAATAETAEPVFPPLTSNPSPDKPRPPMTFEQQADLLEYLHGRMTRVAKGMALVSVTFEIDADQVDDLYLTAKRLRRMAAYEDDIRHLVMGQ